MSCFLKVVGIFLLPVVLFLGLADCQQASVDIKSFSFQPSTLIISPGTTVTWINQDNVPHTVSSSDDKFESGKLEKGEEFKFTFMDAGDYSYYCSLHPSMRGLVTVASSKQRAPQAPGQHETAKAEPPEPVSEKQPGFEASFALAGLLIAACIMRRMA